MTAGEWLPHRRHRFLFGFGRLPCTKLASEHAEIVTRTPPFDQLAQALGQRFVSSIHVGKAAQHVAEPVDYVLMANTFHGVPDQTGLARALHSLLRPQGLFAVANWYPSLREDTPVLGEPRGPRADMRMSPQAVAAVVEPAGFKLAQIVELPPYHYGAVFEALP